MNTQTTALLLILASGCLSAHAETPVSDSTNSQDKAENAEASEIVIIVNKENDVEEISANELRKLYLGKSRQFSKGGLAKLASLDSLSTRFNKSILRKSNAQFDSIWSRLRFSGRAKPPEIFDDPAAVVDFVSNTRHAIGFIPGSSSALTVKTIFKSN